MTRNSGRRETRHSVSSPVSNRTRTPRAMKKANTSSKKDEDVNVSCNVDKNLLDSLFLSLKRLRCQVQTGAQAEGGNDEIDGVNPNDINEVLHHLLSAVSELSNNVYVIREQC